MDVDNISREFVELPQFQKSWKELNLSDSDLKNLQIELLINPKCGQVMRETGGVRKMRFAFEHQGKSGSARVIYVDVEQKEKLYLITAFAKNEKENLSKEERNEIKSIVTYLKKL